MTVSGCLRNTTTETTNDTPHKKARAFPGLFSWRHPSVICGLAISSQLPRVTLFALNVNACFANGHKKIIFVSRKNHIDRWCTGQIGNRHLKKLPLRLAKSAGRFAFRRGGARVRRCLERTPHSNAHSSPADAYTQRGGRPWQVVAGARNAARL